MQNFLSMKPLDHFEPEMQSSAKNLYVSIDSLRLGASLLLDLEANDTPKRHTEVQKLADVAACIYASYACILRSNRSLKLKLPNALDECVIARAVCDRNTVEANNLLQCIEDGPIKTFEKYHAFVTHLMLQKENDFPVHPLTRFF